MVPTNGSNIEIDEGVRSRSHLQRSSSRQTHAGCDDAWNARDLLASGLQGGQQQQQQGLSQFNFLPIGQSGQSLGYHQVGLQEQGNSNSLGEAPCSSQRKEVVDGSNIITPQLQKQPVIESEKLTALKGLDSGNKGESL